MISVVLFVTGINAKQFPSFFIVTNRAYRIFTSVHCAMESDTSFGMIRTLLTPTITVMLQVIQSEILLALLVDISLPVNTKCKSFHVRDFLLSVGYLIWCRRCGVPANLKTHVTCKVKSKVKKGQKQGHSTLKPLTSVDLKTFWNMSESVSGEEDSFSEFDDDAVDGSLEEISGEEENSDVANIAQEEEFNEESAEESGEDQSDDDTKDSAGDEEGDIIEDGEAEDGDDDSMGDGDEKDDDDSIGEEEEEDDEDFEDDIQTMSKEDSNKEIEKGKAVQQQLRVWDSLLEIRIRLQQVIIHANKLPQPEQYQTIVPEKSLSEREDVRLAVSDVLDSLIELKEYMISNNPDTSTEGSVKRPIDDDEEILSSEDESEISKTEVKTVQQTKSRKHTPKRRKLEDYETDIQKRYESLTPFRNQTIQKWNDRTQVASGKFNKKSFSAFQISTMKQIEQIFNDRDRLIHRTQLKRSSYEIIGKPEKVKDESETKDGNSTVEPEYDPEIFDDDDFYHQLLRELIERKTSNVTDPIQLSRHWLELQKFRSKMKRKVDTKASKARKIRYDIIPKLVNFMAPVDERPITDHAMNELFSSLFGQRK